MRRGRGLARLIEGLQQGDPAAIGLTVVLGFVLVGWIVYKFRTGPRG